jgi:hypothetical protein
MEAEAVQCHVYSHQACVNAADAGMAENGFFEREIHQSHSKARTVARALRVEATMASPLLIHFQVDQKGEGPRTGRATARSIKEDSPLY